MLELVSRLFEQLHAQGVRHCHWKSNWKLEEAIAGETDLDLLVRRQDAALLRAILRDLGFRPAVELGVPPFPSVEHYHALDEASGAIVHVHVYYRVITGGSLAKGHHLPLEEMLLESAVRTGDVSVPSKAAELVVFVLRMCLKHSSVAELALLARDWDAVREEAAWLSAGGARAEAADLLRAWLPVVEPELFEAALAALLAPAALLRRVVLARRIRARLSPFARHGRAGTWLVGTRTLVAKGIGRVRGTRRKLAPGSGGAVVAFVGAEATGKSTTIDEIERWLSPHFTVRRVHAGKPPSTALTAVPNLLLPALRALLPGQRSTRVSARLVAATGEGSWDGRFPLLFGIRSVLLAHDRRAVLTRAFARSANGEIVLCDRYPSLEQGALDGAQLRTGDSAAHGRLRRWLSDREARLYRDIPSPDLVLQLTAPLEVTLERNRARAKVEPDEYVTARHARNAGVDFGRSRVERVDTDRPPGEAVQEIKRVIWSAL